jgi:hypothetical protein
MCDKLNSQCLPHFCLIIFNYHAYWILGFQIRIPTTAIVLLFPDTNVIVFYQTVWSTIRMIDNHNNNITIVVYNLINNIHKKHLWWEYTKLLVGNRIKQKRKIQLMVRDLPNTTVIATVGPWPWPMSYVLVPCVVSLAAQTCTRVPVVAWVNLEIHKRTYYYKINIKFELEITRIVEHRSHYKNCSKIFSTATPQPVL